MFFIKKQAVLKLCEVVDRVRAVVTETEALKTIQMQRVLD